MRFSTKILSLVLSFPITALSAPICKRALTDQSFNDFTISVSTS
jgi:hypothetical protein